MKKFVRKFKNIESGKMYRVMNGKVSMLVDENAAISHYVSVDLVFADLLNEKFFVEVK